MEVRVQIGPQREKPLQSHAIIQHGRGHVDPRREQVQHYHRQTASCDDLGQRPVLEGVIPAPTKNGEIDTQPMLLLANGGKQLSDQKRERPGFG